MSPVFSHNRERVLAGDIAAEFMAAVLNLSEITPLLSSQHFSMHGMQIQAWASMKSFRRRDGSDQYGGPDRDGDRDFHKEKRSHEKHASTTGPDPRLSSKSKGREAKLTFTGHLLMENRSSLVVDSLLTRASGTAKPAAALDMLDHELGSGQISVGADKAYDTADFVAQARDPQVTPHVAQDITPYRSSNIDDRPTRHERYRVSQVIRKRIEETNGWIKEVAGMVQTKQRGSARVAFGFRFVANAYNLIRLLN